MRKELETGYAPEIDCTFVMEYTYDDNGDICKMECVGWYCGEPNDEMTKHFCHGGGNLVATF